MAENSPQSISDLSSQKSDFLASAMSSRLGVIAKAIRVRSVPPSEKAKLLIELEKLHLEKDKVLVGVLVEDFKARWQELLNFENENSRWQTLYVTALILVISWVLSNFGAEGRYKSIHEIFWGEKAYFVLTLALINAVYTLAMAYKGYQIQEIAQYLFTNIGTKISPRIDTEFNSWERWRRDETGRPTSIRTIFYVIIGFLPTAVSGTILTLYAIFGSPQIGLLVFFFFVSAFVVMTFIVAVKTTEMNRKWDEILQSKKTSVT